GQRSVRIIQQGHVGDAWRYRIDETGEAECRSIAFEAAAAHAQVHVRLAVDAAQPVAGMDAGATPQADALQLSIFVEQLLPALVERTPAWLAAHPHVQVAQRADRQSLGLSANAPARHRAV